MSDKDFSIVRQQMDVPITQTDGCGMMLPSVSKKNFMARLPWLKGLISSFDFVKFIKQNNCSPVVKDIWGQEHDIIAEDIRIIFFKSQLKAYKYFDNWQSYKDRFKKYGCTAGKCNVEEDNIPTAKINYQMIQTLYDLSDEEIISLAKQNDEEIIDVCRNSETMLKVFGASDDRQNKTGFQKCLNIYPELLADPYTKATLRDLKESLEKDLWAAKFKLDCKYTFVLPDFYAVCENIFMGIENPKGILNREKISCRLYDGGLELDCLRSPHLAVEHAVRENIIDDKTKEWFNTDAIYVSVDSLLSKVLQYDSDGDKLLVVNNKTIINAAKRVTKDIVPLYYYMAKAGAVEVTPDHIYDGLIAAYTGGNIGEISNSITKIWNNGELTEEKYKVIKWLCLLTNFTVDYAKTLYKPEEPDWVHDLILKYTRCKVPAFFKYAKNKEKNQVEEINDSTVNKIYRLFPPSRYRLNFKNTIKGKFDYKLLLHNQNAKCISKIAETFINLTSTLKFNNVGVDNCPNYFAVFDNVKAEMRKLPYDDDTILDSLVIYLFYEKKKSKKRAFWMIYGDDVYNNLKRNIDEKSALCPTCGQRFIKIRHDQIYCCTECRKTTKGRHTICLDCGCEIQTSGRANRKVRCDACAKKHKSELARIRYQNRKFLAEQEN